MDAERIGQVRFDDEFWRGLYELATDDAAEAQRLYARRYLETQRANDRARAANG
jgi:hypothetical protein